MSCKDFCKDGQDLMYVDSMKIKSFDFKLDFSRTSSKLPFSAWIP